MSDAVELDELGLLGMDAALAAAAATGQAVKQRQDRKTKAPLIEARQLVSGLARELRWSLNLQDAIAELPAKERAVIGRLLFLAENARRRMTLDGECLEGLT